MTSANVSLAEIVTELHSLHNQQATGVLYITTDTNKSAQVILENGEIVFVYCAGKRGDEAIDLLAGVQAGRFRFQTGGVVRRDPLPPTLSILSFLNGERSNAIDTIDTDTVQGVQLSEEQRTSITIALAMYVGPLADFICKDHLGSAATLEEAIEKLASEIPSPVQASEFKKAVLKQLS